MKPLTGRKSEELNQKIEKKKAERQALLVVEWFNLTKRKKVIEKNPSRAVAEALGIPLGTMLAWIYGFFAAGICLILIITSEDLSNEKGKLEEVQPLQKKKSSLDKRRETRPSYVSKRGNPGYR